MALDADKRPHVLFVDDEHDVADTQALRLDTTYRTTVAYGDEDALELGGWSTSSCSTDGAPPRRDPLLTARPARPRAASRR